MRSTKIRGQIQVLSDHPEERVRVCGSGQMNPQRLQKTVTGLALPEKNLNDDQTKNQHARLKSICFC